MKLSRGDKILLMLIGLTIVLTMVFWYLSIYATNPRMEPVISFGWVEIAYLITSIISISLLTTVYFVKWGLRKLKTTMKDAIKEGIIEAEKEKAKEKR